MFPDEFRDFVWTLGRLRIERNFIETIGDWLEGSGWTKIYEYSSNTFPGKVDSFLSCAGVAGIKRSRNAHQVSLAALVTLANEAFQAQSEFRNYKDWKEDLKRRSETATSWFTMIELEMLLFSFVRNLRQSDFSLFTTSFEAILPWLAPLDHSNYLRSGCIFLCDMHRLPASVADKFVKGHFTIKKSERIFSAIEIDQAHEQKNKSVNGRAIGILDNEQALLEWAVSGPYIANIVCSTENTLSTNHHEDNDSFEKDFREKRSLLIETLKKFDNPFTDSQPDLINIVSKEVMSEKAATSVRNAYSVGKNQCSDFSDDQRMSIYATVRKNRLVFSDPRVSLLCLK